MSLSRKLPEMPGSKSGSIPILSGKGNHLLKLPLIDVVSHHAKATSSLLMLRAVVANTKELCIAPRGAALPIFLVREQTQMAGFLIFGWEIWAEINGKLYMLKNLLYLS